MKIILSNEEANKILEDHFKTLLDIDSVEIQLEEINEIKFDVVTKSFSLDPVKRLIGENPKLYDFLVKKKALHSYINNWKEDEFSTYIGDLNTAFTWHMTPEGFGFWKSLEEEFGNL